MGVKEEVEALKLQIKKGIDLNDQQLLSTLLKQAFDLCEHVKQELEEGGVEKKKELGPLMQDFKEFLAKEGTRLSKKAGLTEEEFLKYNETPENFTPEQWEALQNVRKKFAIKTKEIRQVIKHKRQEIQIAKPAEKQKFGLVLPKDESSTVKKKAVLKKVKKSKWMKT